MINIFLMLHGTFLVAQDFFALQQPDKEPPCSQTLPKGSPCMLNYLPQEYQEILKEIVKNPDEIESLVPMKGGESNFFIGKLSVAGKDYFLRIAKKDPSVYLENQSFYLTHASRLGISPHLYFISQNADLTLHEYLPASPLSLSQVRGFPILKEIISLIIKTQSIPPAREPQFPFIFLMKRLESLEAFSDTLPPHYISLYRQTQPPLFSLIKKLNKTIINKVTHSDLDYGNILLHQETNKLWLVDWEMARVTDSYLDLASLSLNFRLNPHQEDQILTHYCLESPKNFDRVRFKKMKLVLLFSHSIYFITKAYHAIQNNPLLKWDESLDKYFQENLRILKPYAIKYAHINNYDISSSGTHCVFLLQQAATWALSEIYTTLNT